MTYMVQELRSGAQLYLRRQEERPHSGEGRVGAKAVSFLMVTFNCNIGIVIIIT